MAGENPIKRLVPIYVFPKMKLPKQNYYVLSPNFHIHVSLSDLYCTNLGIADSYIVKSLIVF